MHNNSHSPVFSAIIIYIIIILIIAITKPNFLYDHDTKKFKEFGFSNNQSIITLTSLGIALSFVIYNFLYIITPKYPKYYNAY